MKKEIHRFILILLLISQSWIAFSQNGYPLDFLEDWSSGSFETNNWIIDGENWTINAQFGNPSPSAEFTWDPIQTDYYMVLESYPFLADSLFTGQIYLDFNILLWTYLPTGDEKLFVQVWDWESKEWFSVDMFSNENGDFGWTTSHIDITQHSLGKVFKVRFLATGMNSLDILSWFVDNIRIYRNCSYPPFNLQCAGGAGGINLHWYDLQGFEDEWVRWCDELNSSAWGIGGPCEFNVAGYYAFPQIAAFKGGKVTKIGFFPDEAEATYNVRIWSGEWAENLVVEQPVMDPSIGQWNTVELNSPVPIDIEQDLWIGYYVNASSGYPAGLDDGPTIEGYGNMINYGGEWQTLLQLDPEMEGNWSIRALIEFDSSYIPDYYAIYRMDDFPDYFLRDITNTTIYFDDSVCFTPSWSHSYKVTGFHITDQDTCETGFSNESSEVCSEIKENEDRFNLLFYPNPANDLLTIESGEMIGVITFYNYNGRMIFRKEIKDRKCILPVDNLPEGVYLLRIETGKGVVSRKVVIMR